MSIDWLDASVAERKVLYGYVKRALDEKNKTVRTFFRELFGVHASIWYEKSLQSGRYSKKMATPIFDWLENNKPEFADRTLEDILNARRAMSAGTKSKIIRSAPNSPQLELSLWLTENTEETRFLFRSRAIPFIHPESSFEQLERFRENGEDFSWHVINGPGGTGKSRLALEYSLNRFEMSEDAIGFLPVDRSKDFDWHTCNPITRHS